MSKLIDMKRQNNLGRFFFILVMMMTMSSCARVALSYAPQQAQKANKLYTNTGNL